MIWSAPVRLRDIVGLVTIVNVPLKVAGVELIGQAGMKCKEERLVMLY